MVGLSDKLEVTMLNFVEHLKQSGEFGYCPACVYYRKTGLPDDHAECVKNSPNMTAIPLSNVRQELEYKAFWPVVYEGDTCGEGLFDESFDYDSL